jgi:hydrogenase nickel incorporation protein HypA/HybF
MHELSIALSILEVAAEEAEKRAAARVRAIRLRLGPLSGVDKDALLSAFTLARETSPLTEASLVVEEVPVRIRCPQCRAERAIVSSYELVCADCGTASAEITQGRELEVVALEIE